MSACGCRPGRPCAEAERLAAAFDEASSNVVDAWNPRYLGSKRPKATLSECGALEWLRLAAEERWLSHLFRAGIVEIDAARAQVWETAQDYEQLEEAS